MAITIDRRTFIAALGGATASTAWPLAARAQQSAMPVIGFLSSLTPSDAPNVLPTFDQGLGEMGFVVGRNVAIEYRWAEGQYDRLPALAADLVRRQVAVIAAISGTPAALAAKAASATIPVVFAMGSDPVSFGLVTSLNRPDGKVTGATFFTASLGAKRLQFLRELAPKATSFGLLVNLKNPPSATDATNVQEAARAIGLHARVFDVAAGHEIDAAFTTIVREQVDAVYVGPDPLFLNERDRVTALAARIGVPAIYADREIAQAGGLISYGGSRADAYRQAGLYAGRILKGEKPGDLPVLLPTKFELVINLKAAKALGLTIPLTLQVGADEVIE